MKKIAKKIIEGTIFYILLLGIFGAIAYFLYLFVEKKYDWFLFIVITNYIGTAITAIVIFVQKRQNQSRVTWLVITILIPIAGMMVFYLFGQRYRNSLDYNKRINQESIKREKFNNDKEGNISCYSQLTKKGEYKSDFEFMSSNKGFDTLFEEMEKAEKFIHIIYYIIKPGEIYEEFKNLLIKKSKQGVEIRMLIDDFGQWAMPWYEINELKSYGINIQILGKVVFPFISSQNGYRYHRKLVVVDGNRVITGGANLADEYANMNKKYGIWIDYNVLIKGEVVRSYSLLFLQMWNDLVEKPIEYDRYLLENKAGQSNSIMIEDGPNYKDQLIHQVLIKMFLSAKNKISFTTPYLVPTPEIIEALKTALLSGVEVEIFVPGKTDKKAIVYTATKYWSNYLQNFGAKIYVGKNMLIHSKIGLIDNNIAWFGSFNIDYRSIYSQFEMVSILEGKDVKQILDLFEKYEEYSRVLKDQEWKNNKFISRMIRVLIMFFAPML